MKMEILSVQNQFVHMMPTKVKGELSSFPQIFFSFCSKFLVTYAKVTLFSGSKLTLKEIIWVWCNSGVVLHLQFFLRIPFCVKCNSRPNFLTWNFFSFRFCLCTLARDSFLFTLRMTFTSRNPGDSHFNCTS